LYHAGDCVFIETNYYKDGIAQAHLFVVILDTREEDDQTILIPMDIIPARGFYDDTTILNVGDHDFIKEPTYMNYYYGRIRQKNWIDQNGIRREPPISDSLLQRISSGITRSDQTPNDVFDKYLFRKM